MPPLHHFRVGQDVEYLPGVLHDVRMKHRTFKVVQLLPNDGADREYRVRNLLDGHERVVRESQLRAI